jgi:phosphatidylinositol alpha-mannosyltransferase
MPTKSTRLRIGLALDDSLDKTDGVQQYVLTLGSWLLAQGHEVHYLVGATKRTDLGNIHSLSKNIAVRFNGNRMSVPLPTSKPLLKRAVQDYKLDVLHVQMPYSPFMAGRLIDSIDGSTAVIGTFHIVPNSWLVTLASRALRLLVFKSLNRFNAILSVSAPAQLFASKAFGISSTVVPNVFDYSTYKQAVPFKKFKSVVSILYLGRLVPRKGCMELLKALALIAEDKSIGPFHVTICGKGPLEIELKDYTALNGLTEYVTFEGFVSEQDKPRYYASADISVFPSTGGESFGIVLIEAMASGRAVVLAADNPGYASLMEPRPSLLFKVGDEQDLASKLKEFIANNDERKQAAQWGSHYAQNFDIETVGPQVEAMYVKALRKIRRT